MFAFGSSLCKKCKKYYENKNTRPYCVKCGYCKNKKHILLLKPDKILYVYCYICDYDNWSKELKLVKKND